MSRIKMRSVPPTLRVMLIVVGLLALTASGVAFAQSASAESSLIEVCANQTHMRVIDADESCKRNETHYTIDPEGSEGPPGTDGDDGAVGADGPPGTDGDDGAIGADGPPGADGEDGAIGADGPPGADGEDGAVGADGPPGADGEDGAVGADGPPGGIDPLLEARIVALETFRDRFGGRFPFPFASSSFGNPQDYDSNLVSLVVSGSKLSGLASPLLSLTNCTLGEVMLFAGTFAPRGTAYAHGQLLPISSNTALFSLLGTTYGGDGRTSFGLPEMRGLEPAGVNYVVCIAGDFPSRS